MIGSFNNICWGLGGGVYRNGSGCVSGYMGDIDNDMCDNDLCVGVSMSGDGGCGCIGDR